MNKRTGTWRWRNVPIPEAHVAGLVLGAALHAFAPRQAIQTHQPHRIAGWTSIGAGILVAAWAVAETGNVDVESPSELVTTGPYAISRNPMYVAWTALYVGIALVLNTLWLFVLLPIVAVVTHLTVRHEERSLERTFGDDYRDYANDVRRYL